jgi:hypothetical protein
LGLQIKEDEMDWTYGTYGGEEKYTQDLDGEIRRTELLGRPMLR